MELELTPMRARTGGDPPTGGRELLDLTLEPVARRFADQSHIVARFCYTDLTPVRRGRILIVEANLTNTMPWDVQTWAEKHHGFPDDKTTDQFFDHRQFESYRRLGEHQIKEGVESEEWDRAGLWTQASR
jgi:hypothetical protein